MMMCNPDEQQLPPVANHGSSSCSSSTLTSVLVSRLRSEVHELKQQNRSLIDEKQDLIAQAASMQKVMKQVQ
jgi:hypothetical protein